jgi:mRNA interferase MazF
VYNTNSNQLGISRGDIFLANLNSYTEKTFIQQGVSRPVIIVSNEKANMYSPVITILPLTSKLDKTKLPTHVVLNNERCGLKQTSLALAEQNMPLDKINLIRKVGRCPDELMQRIDMAIMIQMGIFDLDKANELADMINRIDDRANKIGYDIEDASYRESLLNDLKMYCEQTNYNHIELINKRQNYRYKKAV